MTHQSARILIVDDEPAICQNCVKILTKAGYETAFALDGHDALRLLSNTPFELVITDLKMSRLGGMELLRRIKETMPDTTMVIVITGFATVSSAVEVMKLGAFDYLPKPFTPDELRAVVNQAVQARQNRLQNQRLANQYQHRQTLSHQLVGHSPKISKVIEMIAKVASTNATVLVYGESGTGKELVARAVHANSKRKDKVFFAVDCGALSGNLLESELFGHVRGAFTGAHTDKEGIFQKADGGTVFLDEIGNISTEAQGKLLRFLETRELFPLGSTTARKINVRLILATNQNLEEMVAANQFRQDFYYRIYIYPIILPPLRERREDILPIAYHFLNQLCRQMGKTIKGLTNDAANQLTAYDWPGNVRQLRNVIERSVILCDTERIGIQELALKGTDSELTQLMDHIPATNAELKELKKAIRQKAVQQIEKKFILNALMQCDWNITHAAQKVGLQRTNFQSMMRKYGIKRLI